MRLGELMVIGKGTREVGVDAEGGGLFLGRGRGIWGVWKER